MQKILIIIISIVIFFLLVFALLKNANKILPDLGRVVEKGGITCIKFRDVNKNYVWGEITVEFDNKFTGTDAHRFLKAENLRLKDSDVINYATGSSYIVAVPRGSEEDIVRKLVKKEGIRQVGLINCE